VIAWAGNDLHKINTMNWKLLSSEYLYRDNWFTARRDRCERPDGQIVDPYYVLEYPDWVTAVALTAEGQVIMIRQYRHALGETILEIPGGCIDATDTDPEMAIRRELLEETGYAFEQVGYMGKVSPNPSTNTNIMHMFLATGGKKVAGQNLDANEEIEVLLFEKEAVKQLLLENKIVQSLHATCLFYGFERM
jgi:ADP-ribose pyrophosphatase